MADHTLSAVDSLLGLLGTAIKDEATLLSGVKGDIQFIKDEMDSMNGFLLHLTKTETEHNDQHRAWMKQVRDIAYIAEDCIRQYMCDLTPPAGGGPCASGHCLPNLLRTYPTHRNLAKKLHELKDRVREVGERRLRYGVSVPDATPKPELVVKDGDVDEKREEFLRALNQAEIGHISSSTAGAPSSPSFNAAISLLPDGVPPETVQEIGEILKKRELHHVDSMAMLLRALYTRPHGTKEELEKLKKKLEDRANVHWEVMVSCYSKLSTHYKSCLQYLTAFLAEASISRTSLVRRWAAEGLVVAGDGGLQTLEEAGECCFDELVFRGFVRPAPGTLVVPGLKIKSCYMEKSVRDFVEAIAKSENFVSALPTHLHHQLRIRKISQRQPPNEPPQRPRCPWSICPRKPPPQDDDDDKSKAAAEEKLHPMDELVRLLKSLPEEYRLNVLDLGGCRGMNNRRLKSICKCKVVWLRYLSLRNTDVSCLPKEINNFRQLETLDIRQTPMPTTATEHINLPKLKHLLAGNPAGDKTHQTLSAVQVPHIGTSMEILRHVQVLHGQELDKLVGHLKQLRKLGVVFEGSEENIKHLVRTISKLSDRLRSLSVCITQPQSSEACDVGGVIRLNTDEATWFSPPKNLESLNIRGSSASIESLPRFIEALSRLSKITLRDTQLTRDSLQTLGKLESLCCLRLHHGSYADQIITMDVGEFKKLRFLLIDLAPLNIKFNFKESAAPKLEKIGWMFPMTIMEDTFSGIKNLGSLKELEIHSDDDLSLDQWNHVKQALSDHEQQPLLTCSLRNSVSNDDLKEVSVIGK